MPSLYRESLLCMLWCMLDAGKNFILFEVVFFVGQIIIFIEDLLIFILDIASKK